MRVPVFSTVGRHDRQTYRKPSRPCIFQRPLLHSGELGTPYSSSVDIDHRGLAACSLQLAPCRLFDYFVLQRLQKLDRQRRRRTRKQSQHSTVLEAVNRQVPDKADIDIVQSATSHLSCFIDSRILQAQPNNSSCFAQTAARVSDGASDITARSSASRPSAQRLETKSRIAGDRRTGIHIDQPGPILRFCALYPQTIAQQIMNSMACASIQVSLVA